MELVDCLVERLNQRGIAYCHWKSNFALAQALTGDLDLDLLVGRSCLPDTILLLTQLGFKPAAVQHGPTVPGIYHFYGVDGQSGQLLHLHLFSRVLTGESFVKSHQLPFEQMLLTHTEQIGAMRVAAKPAELVLFVLRTFIKYGSPLDLLYLWGEEDKLAAELQWLLSGAEMDEALKLLQRYCPVIDARLFGECMDAIRQPASLLNRLRLAWIVRRHLRSYAKYTGWQRTEAYVRLLWGHLWRRLRGQRKEKVLQSGGAVIALIGAEATGKSTLVATATSWLGDVFVTQNIHVGKPPSAWLTLPINVFLPAVRNLAPRLRTTRIEGHLEDTKPASNEAASAGTTGLVYALRAVALAWDRRVLLLKARRAAAHGALVICDRYPSEEVGAMDSPRLRLKAGSKGLGGWFYNKLARLEAHLYQQMPPPDVALRLTVDLETAKQRNRDRIKPGKESDAYLESRHRQSREWRRAGTQTVYDIDTGKSLPETVLEVKKRIWAAL